MKIYYEAKTLDRTIDAAPRITPSTKSVLKKIIRSAPVAEVADEMEKLRKERDAVLRTLSTISASSSNSTTLYEGEHGNDKT